MKYQIKQLHSCKYSLTNSTTYTVANTSCAVAFNMESTRHYTEVCSDTTDLVIQQFPQNALFVRNEINNNKNMPYW